MISLMIVLIGSSGRTPSFSRPGTLEIEGTKSAVRLPGGFHLGTVKTSGPPSHMPSEKITALYGSPGLSSITASASGFIFLSQRRILTFCKFRRAKSRPMPTTSTALCPSRRAEPNLRSCSSRLHQGRLAPRCRRLPPGDPELLDPLLA